MADHFENLKENLAAMGWKLDWPATSAWPREATDKPDQERRLSELREWRRNLGQVQDYPLPIEDIDALLLIADERDNLRNLSGKAQVSRWVLCPTCRGHQPPDHCETCDNTGKVEQRQVA